MKFTYMLDVLVISKGAIAMGTIVLVVAVVSFVAFIVLWRKKVAAKKAAGEDYKSDPQYRSIRKKKRIAGVVCVLALAVGVVAANSGGDDSADKPGTYASSEYKALKIPADSEWNLGERLSLDQKLALDPMVFSSRAETVSDVASKYGFDGGMPLCAGDPNAKPQDWFWKAYFTQGADIRKRDAKDIVKRVQGKVKEIWPGLATFNMAELEVTSLSATVNDQNMNQPEMDRFEPGDLVSVSVSYHAPSQQYVSKVTRCVSYQGKKGLKTNYAVLK